MFLHERQWSNCCQQIALAMPSAKNAKDARSAKSFSSVRQEAQYLDCSYRSTSAPYAESRLLYSLASLLTEREMYHLPE